MGGRPRLYEDFDEIAKNYNSDWVEVKTYAGKGAYEIKRRIEAGKTEIPGGIESWELSVDKDDADTTTLWARHKG